MHCISLLLLYSLIDCNSLPFHFIQTLYSSCAKRQILNTKRQCQSKRRNAGCSIQKLTCLIEFVWVVHVLSACSVVVATVWQFQIQFYKKKSQICVLPAHVQSISCKPLVNLFWNSTYSVYLFACLAHIDKNIGYCPTTSKLGI